MCRISASLRAARGGGSPSVQYAYDSGGSGSNEIRPGTLTYPSGRVITYSYGSGGGMNDRLCRVQTIHDTTNSVDLATYAYLGIGTVVRITYSQPEVWLDLWGGTSGTFNGLDLFGRVVDQEWQNSITGTAADIDRYKYGYDHNSNRQWRQNTVGSTLDEYYTYDHLNRLTDMQRGTLNGSFTGITGTPAKEQAWSLDATGNWPSSIEKVSGTIDRLQGRTSNTVNEITAINSVTGPVWTTPAYDAAGNTTSFPQPTTPGSSYTATYDAWNRMMVVQASSVNVAAFAYDGRNRRITQNTYTSGTLTETREFYFTSTWQDIEERVSGSMVDQYVYGIRYIDEVVCRDDSTPARYYVMQDANFNVTSICDTSGSVVERYMYDPHGAQTVMNASWTVIGGSAYDWVIGFQGLESDPATGLIYVRYRWLHPELGRWLQRDPVGYVDGLNLYLVQLANPITRNDPFGLVAPGGGNYKHVGQCPPGYHWDNSPICDRQIECRGSKILDPNCPGEGSSHIGGRYQCRWDCACPPGYWWGTSVAKFYTDIIITNSPCDILFAPSQLCCRDGGRCVDDEGNPEPPPERNPGPIFGFQPSPSFPTGSPDPVEVPEPVPGGGIFDPVLF